MAGLSTGAPIVKVYHEKSMILPDVSRVLACLYEKDIKFETHTASYKSLLRLQASNHAPVPFYDGPSFLEESREICRYIAETYEDHGYPFLLGKDSLERASIEQWLHHEEHAFNPPSRSLFCHLAFPLDEQDDDIDLQKRKLEEVLEVYEQRLSDSEFLAGNKFTLADLVHLPNSHYITESGKFVYLYDSRKNVQRWWNAISTRDSWQKVLKDIKKVDQQRKQEELEKQQQQQWQRGNPRTTRRQIRLDSRKHTSTKSQTILVPPPLGIISTSPAAPQAEKPRPAETSPAEKPVSSSLSTPTTPKSSAVQRKHVTISTTHRDTLQVPVQSTPTIPEKSPIPIQRTSTFFTPATSPTTSEKPPRIDADKSSIRDVSIPSEATKTDHPTKSKPSSTKKVSNNLHVFDFYKASSHTDEAEPYIEPTPQKTSEMLDKFSETDGSSDATLHAKTSPKSAKDGSDQLRASGFYKSDSTATSADSQHKESARYTERAPQRPAETIDGRSTVQRATDASPGKLRSTEVYQKLQAEQWHAATAGLSNLKRETDHLMPTQQVKPGKDVQQYSSQDSKQASTRPLAQEPVSMDGQQVQGPEMPTRAPYTDQKRDLSSMLWQQAADVQGIAEEDEASSDHNRGAVLPPYTRKHAGEAKIVSVDRRKDASLSKHVPDEAAQAIPFQEAYDDAHDTTQEARETASAPRRTRAQDARDTSEGIRTYHSASSRSQPIDAPQDAAPPSKKTAFEGPRHATTPYPGAQEFINQARESPASRPTVPHDAQDSTEEEETLESSSSRARLLDSHSDDAYPRKQSLDEDGYGAIAPLQTGYTDDQYNMKQDRDTAAPRRMMAQDAFEEKKIVDSASFKAQTFDYPRVDAPSRKQPPAEDPRTTTSPFQKRYSGNEDTTKQSKHAASRPRRMAAQEVQDNFEETMASDSWSSREQPPDPWRAPGPLPRHEVDDAHSTTAPFKKRYPGTGGTTKEVEDVTSTPVAGEDAPETFEETKIADSASSRAQPLDYQRTDAPSRRQETIEYPLGATSPFEKRYADVEDTTKHSRDTAFKPRNMVGQDTQDASEEAEARNSALFRAQPPGAPGQKQPPDAWRAATTPSKPAAAEDALSVSRSSPTRYPRAEEINKQPRTSASVPMHIAAQDARDASRKSEVSDLTSFIEQPSDAGAAVPLPKQEVPDAHSVTAPFQKRQPDTEGTTKEAKSTVKEIKTPDSASSRVQPLDSQRADAPSRKKEAAEHPHRATSPFKKRHSDVEGTIKQSRDNAVKPRQIVGQDAQGTYKETKAGDFALRREQSSDTWQAATTPIEQVATQDGLSLTPPSEKRSPSDEDTIKRPRGTASAPRRTTAQDANDTFQDSKPADSVSSREQPLSAWQPVVTPPRQEIEDTHSTTSAFQKTYPYVDDRTRPAGDTAFAPRKIGSEDTKDITEETKVADSGSSNAKHTYTPRTALPLSEQAEAEEDARDKGRESKETTSAPKKMVSRDAQDSYGERKSTDSTSREQYLDDPQPSSPLMQAAAEDARGATRGAKESFAAETKHSQGVKDTTKKSGGILEETKGPGSTLPTAQSLGAQDAQRTYGSSRTPTADQRKDASTQLQSDVQETYKKPKSSSAHRKGLASGNDDQAIMGEKIFSTELLRQMLKDGQSASSKAQPTDSRSPIKAERTPSVYQEDPLVPQDSHEQAQTLPTGGRADGSTPKRQQAPVVSSTSEEKSTPSAPPRAKVRDDHSTEEPFKRDTVDDRKEALPLLGQEPTSQIQRATELLQEAAPDGDMSSKSSTIEQWWRASVPLQDATPNSGNDLPNVSTIDQKPIPMSQQAIPSARGANEMNKRSVEKRVEPPAPTGAQTSNVERAPPSFPGAVMVERAGEPVQMQAPTLDARPTSAATPTKRATPDARETGDQEFVNTSDGKTSKASKASHHSAIIHEDVSDASSSTHGATIDNKTTSHASEAQGSGTWPDSKPTPVNVRRPTSDDQLASRYLRDQRAQPPESTQEQTPLEAPRDPVPTQDIPSDVLARTIFAKPTSTEGMSPTAGPASTLEAQLPAPLRADPAPLQADAAYAEQKFAPSDKKTARAAQPLSSIESRKEDASVSATNQTKTPQTIFRQQFRPPAPITREVPSSDTQYDTRKIQEVSLDNIPTDDSAIPLVLSHEQVTHAPQTIPDKKDMTPAGDSPASDAQPASAKVQEVIPDSYHTDKLTMPFVSSEKQGSYAGSSTEPHEGPSPDARSTVVDKETTKSPSRQAAVLEARPDSTASDSYVRPTSGDEQGILPDQGVESPTVAQATYSEDLRNSAPTQDIRANALGDFKKLGPHSTEQEAISSAPGQASDLDAQPDSETGEVSPATKKFAPSDSVHSAQQPSPAEPRKEETIVAAAEQLPTTIGQQETQGMREVPTSDTQHASWKIQEVDPDIDLDKSVPSQEKVSQAGHTSESREGLTPLAHSSVVHDETTTAPASLTSISDAALDLTPTSNDVHSTSGIEPGAEPPSSKQAPQHLEALDSVPAEDIPADASGEAQSMRPSVFPDDQRGRPGDAALAEQKFAPSDQDPAHSTQRPFSAEPRNEEIKDSARSAQPLHSTAADQTKDSQTTIGQQDISPAPGTSKSPSSGTDHASGKFQEVARDDHHIIESIPRQGQASRAKNAFEPFKGPAHDAHSAIDEKTMRPPSSQAQNSDSKPDSTQNRNDELSAGLLPNQVAQQHAETQASPPEMGLYDSKSTQDIPPEALGKAKSLKSSSVDQEATASKMASPLTPDTHLGNEPREVAPTGQKLLLKDQDSAQSAQKPSSSKATKEQFTFAAPDQAKASQTIFGQHASRKLLEIPPEDRRIDGSIPSQEQVPRVGHISEAHDGPTRDTHGAIVAEPMAHTTGPTSAPHAQHGMASDQDSDRYSQPLASAAPRKEETNVVASDQTMAQKTTFSHQVITPAPGTSEASGEVLEVGPGDHRSSELTKPLIPNQKQISHAEYSEPHEGPNPDVNGAVVDENTAPPLVSQAHSLEAGPTSTPADGDVHPTSGDESVRGILCEQGTQLPPPFQASIPPEALHDSLSTKNASADASSKVEPLKATGDVTPADQNIAPSEPLSAVESRKEDSTGAEAEQSKVSEPIIGQQDIGNAPGISEFVRDDDRNKESVSSKEQVSHDQRASEPHEGSPPDVHGTFVDKTITIPPSQAQSSDAKRDSSPIRGDADPSSGDQSTTRFLPDQGTQQAATAKLPPPLEALHYSESTQDVPADALGKAKSVKPHSVDQEVMSPRVLPDTQLDTTPGEVAPDEQNYALPAQDLARPAQLPFSAEPAKEETIVAASDQASGAQTIIGQMMPATDKEKNPLSESYSQHASRKSQDDDQVDEPVPSQEQVSLGGHASEPQEGTSTDSHGANVDEKITTSPSPVTSPLHNPEAQTPARTQALPAEALGGPAFIQNVPADSLEKVKSPGPPSTDQEVMEPMIGPEPAPDAPQGTALGEATPAEQKFTPLGTYPVQPPHEASFDLSSDEKTTMIKDDQASTISNVSLSASQAVGQSESSAVKGALPEELVSSFSQKNLKGTSTEENSKQQQQTDQSNNRSSNDDSIEANLTVSPNKSGDIQPAPPKDSMEATEESRNQQQAEQAVFQSTQDNEKQVEETEAQDTGIDEREEMNLHQNTNQKNNGTSQGDALEQSGEHVPGVQPWSKETNNGSKSTEDAPSGIQTDNTSESSLRTSEESKQQVQSKSKTQGGESKAPASKTEQPKERDLPASHKSITSQSLTEASDKSEEQTSSNIQNRDKNSSKLDGSTNDTKSGDMEDYPSS